MPNFDGTGPLNRGRVIGRGQGHCRQTVEGCPRKDAPEMPHKNEGAAE